MSYRISGPVCAHDGCTRGVFEAGLCRPHFDLAWAFGTLPDVIKLEPLDHRSHEFSRELNQWRSQP